MGMYKKMLGEQYGSPSPIMVQMNSPLEETPRRLTSKNNLSYMVIKHYQTYECWFQDNMSNGIYKKYDKLEKLSIRSKTLATDYQRISQKLEVNYSKFKF